jgi:hypothetical protein
LIQAKQKRARNLGKKKEDHGELPMDLPAIDKLLDPIQFIKTYKSKLYNLVTLAKSKSKTCKADAMRLSMNLAYMIAQHTRFGNKGLSLPRVQNCH